MTETDLISNQANIFKSHIFIFKLNTSVLSK